MGPFLAAALPVLGNLAGNLIGSLVQGRHNKNLAKYQNAYNSPQAQMNRFRKAGLNPNLIYTQGSSGNMSPIPTTDYQSDFANLGSQYVGTQLAQTQSDVGQQKILESQAKVQVMAAKKDLINQNPLMRPEYVDALVKQMMSTAKLKQQEERIMTQPVSTEAATAGEAKVLLDLQTLGQKYDLQNADKDIKAQILNSETFRAEILRVQKEWLTDKKITAQHVWQALMMMLTQMLK